MKRPRMEPAVPSPQFVFDLSGEGLRCFSPAPAVAHVGVSYGTPVMVLQALHRTRPSGVAAAQPDRQADETSTTAHVGDPDTVSDEGTPGVDQVVAETGGESEDEAVSFEELFSGESFTRKIGALAELVGMKGALEPAAVLGEVVRVLQEMDRERGRFVCATRTVRSCHRTIRN